MTVTIEALDSVRVISLDYPPVNAYSLAARTALYDALQSIRRDPAAQAIILRGVGRCFSAGGDIRELGTSAATAGPGLSSHIQATIESSPVPVIALLHGLAIGGGLETALACHYRLAHADTLIALPEVSLGIIPLSGTQRLPRLLGLERAATLILCAQRHPAAAFRESALFDRVFDAADGDMLSIALAFARAISGKDKHPLVRERPVPDRQPGAILERLGKEAAGEMTPAQRGALEALRACATEPDFDRGMNCARKIYDGLTRGPELAAAKRAFLT